MMRAGAGIDRAAARRGVAVMALALAFHAPVRADEPEIRTWQDASGRFKIQARYAGMNGTNVLLKKADGSQMQVDMEKLRSADRLYIEARQKQLAEEDPFKPVPAEPAAPGAGSRAANPAMTAPAARPGAVATPAPARPVGAAPSLAPPGPASLPFDLQAKQGAAPDVRPDWSSAVMAELASDGPWSLDVGPAPAASDARPRALPVPPKADFFEKTKGLVVNAPGTRAVIGLAMDKPKPGTSRVILGDLETGKLLGQYRSPGEFAPLALSDSGDKLLTRMDEFGFGNSYRLELWELGPDGLNKEWGFAPYGEMDGGDRDVKWARFIGPDRFATLGGKGKLVIWDLEPLRPRTVLMIDEHCTPGVSPDGRFLAYVMAGNVGVLDVEAGRIAALQAAPGVAPFPTLGFSPSGKRLACASGIKLSVWNTDDGSAGPEILMAPVAAPAGSSPIWTDEDHVLIGGRSLFDVASGVDMCHYLDTEDAVVDRDGLCWFLLRLDPKKPGAVVPARLPQPSVVESLKRALADPNYFVLKPGATVSIDAGSVPDASQRDWVVRALAGRLERIGAKPAAGAPLVLAATVTPGQEREISYRSFGAEFRTDNFKIRPQISGVKLTYQGQVVWEASASGLPMMDFAHLKADESLADHVKKFERPNYNFFETVELPARIPRPRPNRLPGITTLETTKVTPSGVR